MAEKVTVPIRFAFSSKVNGEYRGIIAIPKARENNASKARRVTTGLLEITAIL
jgi:hypothetical protein